MKPMVLVPATSLTSMRETAAAQEYSNLDNEIEQILKSNAPTYTKLYTYLDTLHRYLAMKENIPLPKFEISNLSALNSPPRSMPSIPPPTLQPLKTSQSFVMPKYSVKSSSVRAARSPKFTPIRYQSPDHQSTPIKYNQSAEDLNKSYGRTYVSDMIRESAANISRQLHQDLFKSPEQQQVETELGAVGGTSQQTREAFQRQKDEALTSIAELLDEETSSDSSPTKKTKKKRRGIMSNLDPALPPGAKRRQGPKPWKD